MGVWIGESYVVGFDLLEGERTTVHFEWIDAALAPRGLSADIPADEPGFSAAATDGRLVVAVSCLADGESRICIYVLDDEGSPAQYLASVKTPVEDGLDLDPAVAASTELIAVAWSGLHGTPTDGLAREWGVGGLHWALLDWSGRIVREPERLDPQRAGFSPSLSWGRDGLRLAWWAEDPTSAGAPCFGCESVRAYLCRGSFQSEASDVMQWSCRPEPEDAEETAISWSGTGLILASVRGAYGPYQEGELSAAVEDGMRPREEVLLSQGEELGWCGRLRVAAGGDDLAAAWWCARAVGIESCKPGSADAPAAWRLTLGSIQWSGRASDGNVEQATVGEWCAPGESALLADAAVVWNGRDYAAFWLLPLGAGRYMLAANRVRPAIDPG
ncbi:MAG: hypothetical protein HY905_17080 [Deltaproteobacteria bacterium]|nr:hypothetical protein [Deltaproteobacteria bacterium]